MRVAVNLFYLTPRQGPAQLRELAVQAEDLGFDSIWVGEKLGSDAVSVLAWLSAHTSRIGLGSAALQVPARSPAATAMSAATIDVLSEGRFRLGLGLSGPQVSQTWHGEPLDDPLGRTRAYAGRVRALLDSRRSPDGTGLSLELRPVGRVPLYLAAMGPRNLGLAGEIADGALVLFSGPREVEAHRAHVAAGRAGRPCAGEDFDLVATVPLSMGSDVDACADRVRGYFATYLAAMGTPTRNFYQDQAERHGWGEAVGAVREHYRARRFREAYRCIPRDLIDQTSLLGPRERVAERMREFAAAGTTTLSVLPFSSDETRGETVLEALRECATGVTLERSTPEESGGSRARSGPNR